ncbi:hypothetical protein ACN28I_02115 [Archangium gephyra]|uniref:hypothetical protein n=1 Tax=Archangium gephyra TaxID=48 RepID=UPI003B822792
MHVFPRSAGLALVAACAVLLGVSGEAHATAGVVFVHGTGDQSVQLGHHRLLDPEVH